MQSAACLLEVPTVDNSVRSECGFFAPYQVSFEQHAVAMACASCHFCLHCMWCQLGHCADSGTQYIASCVALFVSQDFHMLMQPLAVQVS